MPLLSPKNCREPQTAAELELGRRRLLFRRCTVDPLLPMAAAILLLSVGATSSSPPAVSAPSLLDALGIEAEVHPTPLHRGRRRLQILTRENTKPLRLHLDFGSLYRETAVPYTTCFQEGAWYRRGFPGPEPPGGLRAWEAAPVPRALLEAGRVGHGGLAVERPEVQMQPQRLCVLSCEDLKASPPAVERRRVYLSLDSERVQKRRRAHSRRRRRGRSDG